MIDINKLSSSERINLINNASTQESVLIELQKLGWTKELENKIINHPKMTEKGILKILQGSICADNFYELAAQSNFPKVLKELFEIDSNSSVTAFYLVSNPNTPDEVLTKICSFEQHDSVLNYDEVEKIRNVAQMRLKNNSDFIEIFNFFKLIEKVA